MNLSLGVYVTSLTLSVKLVSWDGGPPSIGAVQMLRTPDLSVRYATFFSSGETSAPIVRAVAKKVFRSYLGAAFVEAEPGAATATAEARRTQAAKMNDCR